MRVAFLDGSPPTDVFVPSDAGHPALVCLARLAPEVPKGSSEMVAAAIRTIFAQPDAGHVREQLGVIAGMLGRRSPKVETMLRDAAEDLLAFTSFPVAHWKKIWSTNPLERLNKEVKRRTDVGASRPASAASNCDQLTSGLLKPTPPTIIEHVFE